MSELNEKEYLLIRAIDRSPSLTQRELSEEAGLSLGLTNLLLKKLIKKGYVKVQQLNWQKVQYMLTLRGAMEKAKKSYAYAARNYGEYKRMTAVIRANLLEEYGQGLREFVIATPPESDIDELVRTVVQGLELPAAQFIFEYDPAKAIARTGTVFSAVPDPGGRPGAGQRVIELLEDRIPA